MSVIPIYCINLDSRPDRWSKFQNQIIDQKIKVVRFSAIKNDQFPHFGVADSHKNIIEIGKMEGHPFICILEDDVHLCKNFFAELQETIASAPEDWHLIYLGWLVCRNAQIIKINKRISKINHITCAYGIVYNMKSYNIFTATVEKKNVDESERKFNNFKTFDDWLAFDYQIKYPCYVSNKFLVKPIPSYSDIWKHYNGKIYGWMYSGRFLFYSNHLWWFLNLLWLFRDLLNFHLFKIRK